MIQEFLKTINLSPDKFISKNEYEFNIPMQSYFKQKIYYGDFNDAKKPNVINNNFFINILCDKNANEFLHYMINGIYKDFVYCYVISDLENTKSIGVGDIIVKTVKTNSAVCVSEVITKNNLIYYNFPFETKFNDFEYNHKNVIDFLEEKINSGELKHI